MHEGKGQNDIFGQILGDNIVQPASFKDVEDKVEEGKEACSRSRGYLMLHPCNLEPCWYLAGAQ